MKKAILILLVGLFWCNVGFAETKEQTIINEHKSSLPECEGGEADMLKDLSRWSEWDKCFGILKIEVENEETIFHVEFKNGEMHGKGFAEIGDTIMYGKFKNGDWTSPVYVIQANGQILKGKINEKGEVVF